MKKALFVLISLFLFALPGFAAGPVCLFSDVQSGPATGGEGGNGIYLSIFGKNFGSAQGASTVTVNGQAVAQYLIWGHENDVTGNLDQISVQVAKATTGTGDIVVTTPAGSCSNLPFTVRSGNIWYIGPGIDNDTPGKSCAALKDGSAGAGAGGNGTFANPWTLTNVANADTYSESQGAYTPATKRTPETYYNCMTQGDTLVFLNGTSFLYGDGTGMHTSLVLGSNVGTPTSFMTFMARPGATVQLGSKGGAAFGIRDYVDTYVVISGLGLTGSGIDGEGIEFSTGTANNIRFVGNSVTCPDCSGSAAAVSGGWELDQPTGIEVLGNAVTNVACSDAGGVSNKQYHSMYFYGNDVEVGWNKIFNGCAYNGIQVNYFTDESLGFGNISIHDNDISGANGAGINMASVDPAQGPINIFNNVIHHVGLAAASDGSSFHTCIAFPGEAPSAAPGTANVYNNTMYDCSSYLNKIADGNSCTVYMDSETGQTGLKVNLVNNILAQPAYANSANENVYVCGGNVHSMLAGSNNLWFSASAPGSTMFATNAGSIVNPQFVSTTPLNLNLQSNSPAIGAGSAVLHSALDFNGVTRPGLPAIGAYEFGGVVLAAPVTLSATPNPATPGQAVTLTATVAEVGGIAPTGIINFMDGNASLGQASLNASGVATVVLSGLAAGSYSVDASYLGDLHYAAGESAVVAVQVLGATTTALAASSNSVAAGQSLTLTATVAGSGGVSASGTVNFLDGTTLLGTANLNAAGVGTLSIATLANGVNSLTAQYLGDASLLASTSPAVSVTATGGAKQATTTALVATPNPVSVGQALVLTATVKFTGSTVPTGGIGFLAGNTLVGKGTLNASGVVSISVVNLPAGTYSVTAIYTGDANFLSSTSPAVSVTVTMAPQLKADSTSLVASPATLKVGQTLALTATVKWNGATLPTGRVDFRNGATLLGTVALNASGLAKLSISTLPAGSYQLTAEYLGDANFQASTSPAVLVTVKPIALSANVDLTAAPSTLTVGQTLGLTATLTWNGTTTPTGGVGFLSGGKLLGKGRVDALGVVKMSSSTMAAGTYQVTAEYTGDSNYPSNTSALVSVTVNP